MQSYCRVSKRASGSHCSGRIAVALARVDRDREDWCGWAGFASFALHDSGAMPPGGSRQHAVCGSAAFLSLSLSLCLHYYGGRLGGKPAAKQTPELSIVCMAGACACLCVRRKAGILPRARDRGRRGGKRAGSLTVMVSRPKLLTPDSHLHRPTCETPLIKAHCQLCGHRRDKRTLKVSAPDRDTPSADSKAGHGPFLCGLLFDAWPQHAVCHVKLPLGFSFKRITPIVWRLLFPTRKPYSLQPFLIAQFSRIAHQARHRVCCHDAGRNSNPDSFLGR